MELIITDIHIAAFLLASEKVSFTRTKRKNSRVYFYFFPKKDAKEFVDKYWADTVLCPPRKLFVSLKSLKDLVFSGNQHGKN